MKRLDELGISPAPWNAGSACRCVYDDGEYIVHGEPLRAVLPYDRRKANTRLIAAAPKMYECLREAITDECNECHRVNDYESDIDVEWGMCKNCKVKKWRDALAEAAGESEVDNGK